MANDGITSVNNTLKGLDSEYIHDQRLFGPLMISPMHICVTKWS